MLALIIPSTVHIYIVQYNVISIEQISTTINSLSTITATNRSNMSGMWLAWQTTIWLNEWNASGTTTSNCP